MDDDGLAVFEANRRQLTGLAYRMVGVLADADDIVQETWLRWSRRDRAEIINADAWLTTVATRLALDRLRRRKRAAREYVGPWLPEPIVRERDDPAAAAELADSLSLGFMVLLETLSPDERAAFLLADVFGEPFVVVAEHLDRSEAACRQLASRARRKLAAAPLATMSAPDVADRLIAEFLSALVNGDEAAALACLADDVVLVSDGGAHRRAARRPVIGARRVVRFMSTLAGRLDPTWTIGPASVGGLPGYVFRSPSAPPGVETVETGVEMTVETGVETGVEMTVEMVMAFTVVDGRCTRLESILNPEKLSGVAGRRNVGQDRTI